MKVLKACKNPNCDYENKIFKLNNSDKFCIKCGESLYHVCKDCLVILNDNSVHRCEHCQAKYDEKSQSRKGFIKEHSTDIIKLVTFVAGSIKGKEILSNLKKK